MSDERAEIVAAKSDRVVAAMAECGCTLNNAVMQHMFLALPVIPELRVTDLGVVDVRTFERGRSLRLGGGFQSRHLVVAQLQPGRREVLLQLAER